MKKSRANFRWLLHTLKEHCKDAEAANLSMSILEQNGLEKSALFFMKTDTYTKLTQYIFNIKDGDPIKTLQSQGYYLNGDKTILKKNYFDERGIDQLIECFMWANLDKKMPLDLIRKHIGRVKVLTCPDADALLCCWVSTIAARFTKLRPIATITHHFLGLPHFRAVLYSFLKDEELLAFSDNPDVNASFSLKTCVKIGLTPTFDQFHYKQSPLVLMCFLVDAIRALDRVQPPAPVRCVSRSQVARIRSQIAAKKREVAAINVRVSKLQADVGLIQTRLAAMKPRPMSAMAAKGVHEESSKPQRDEEGLPPLAPGDRPQSAMRVSWDIPAEHMPSGRPHEVPREEEEVPVQE